MKMENSDIKIDKEGNWYFRGALMFRKEILSVFFEHLRIDESGKYYIELGPESCYLDVEDTAFVVKSAYKQKLDGDASEQLYVQLTDDSWEKLDLRSLYMGKENIPYCMVKNGKFTARFSRKGYYQLAGYIENDEKDGSFYIRQDDEKFYLNNYVL